MINQTKKNSLFWLGFFISLLVVVGLTAYYYKDNKDKKLKDIKKKIEDFLAKKLKPLSSHPKNTITKTKRTPKKPKKFIVKK
jgi:hypothetical protein